jgi:hypothetical protein
LSPLPAAVAAFSFNTTKMIQWQWARNEIEIKSDAFMKKCYTIRSSVVFF